MIVSSREWSQHQHWWNLRTKRQTKDLDLGPFILRSGALLMELSDTMLWLNQSDHHKNWNIYLVIIWCTYNAHTYTIHMYPPCKKHIHLILISVLLLFLLYRVKGYPDKSKNNTAEPHEFNHPWFQTLIMFIGKKTFYSTYHLFYIMMRAPWQRIHVDYFKFLKVMWHALIPPPNQPKNKTKLVIYDKGMLIQQLMFLKLFKL